jgi:hypothetical protein
VLYTLLAAVCLDAQITPGSPYTNGNGVSATPIPAVRPARPQPRTFRRPLIWGGFDRTEVIVVKEAAPPEKKPAAEAFPLILNPVWEKEKITPKLIEIP